MILAAVLLGVFTEAANSSATNLAVLDVLLEFDLDLSTGAWFVLGYNFSFVVLMPVAGRLANRVGLRRTYLTGMALFALASGAVALAPTYEAVVVGRVLQGFGAAPILPVVMLVVSRAFPPGRRGRAMGVWASANGAGLVLGPVLGGLIVDGYGWRMIFWLEMPLALVALVLVYAALPGDGGTAGRRVDRPSVAFLCAGSTVLMVGLAMPSTTWGSGLLLRLAATVVGVALLVGFRYRASRLPPHVEPVVGTGVLRSADFAVLTVIAGLQVTPVAMLVFVTPLALWLVFDLAIAAVGSLILLLPMSIVFFGLPSGYFSDRVGARRLATVGAGLLVVSPALLAFGVAGRSLPVAVVGLVIGGIGVAGIQAPVAASVAGRIADPQQGAAMGLFHGVRFAGYLIGTSIAASVVELVAPSDVTAGAPIGQVQDAVTSAYVVAAALAVTLLALIWRAHPRFDDAETRSLRAPASQAAVVGPTRPETPARRRRPGGRRW